MKKIVIYADGKYIKVNPQVAEAFTPGHFKARGVFETMLAMGDQVFDVPAHIGRMQKGLKQMRIAFNAKGLPAIIQRVVKANGFCYARVRVVVWQEVKQTHVAVMAIRQVMPVDKKLKVCLVKTNRVANSRLANTKSLDYQLFADAYQRARSRGFDEALLLNARGAIFEASRANIFWFKDRVLYTPPLSSGCLNGITRQALLQQARKLGIPCRVKNLTVEELKKADTVFLTNSLSGIKILATPFLPLAE